MTDSRHSLRNLATASALAVAAWLLARWAQLRWLGIGTGFDVALFADYARRWGAGEAPYADFLPEYPPGAMLVFVLPWLFAGASNYANAFAVEMALFDLAALLLVVAFVHRFRSASVAAGAGVGYVVLSAALFPVLYARFDLVPGMLVLTALYCLYAPRPVLGGALLGVAGAVKLWPFALVPLWSGWAYRRRGVAGLLAVLGSIAGGALLVVAPFVPRAGRGILTFLENHRARGIQLESTWAAIALSCRAMGLSKSRVVANFGALHIAGKLAKVLAAVSIPALLALVLIPQVLAFRRTLGREADEAGEIGSLTALAVTLGFMVGGKVLSPQYMLWIVPLLPLGIVAARNSAGGAIAVGAAMLAAVGLTTMVFPYRIGALAMSEEGHGTALLCLGLRNACLLALYVFVTWRIARRPLDAGRSHGTPQTRG